MSKTRQDSPKIRIKGQFRNQALSIIESNNITPLDEIQRDDGDITFVLPDLPGEVLVKMLDQLPKEYWAMVARVQS